LDLNLALWRHNRTFATYHEWSINIDSQEVGSSGSLGSRLQLSTTGSGVDHEGGVRTLEALSVYMTPNSGYDKRYYAETWLHTVEELLAFQPPAIGTPDVTTTLLLDGHGYRVVLFPPPSGPADPWELSVNELPGWWELS
jgi:hypothetical protein